MLEDPAVAALSFRARHSTPATPISPHPQDVLDQELQRVGLPEDTGLLFWAAIHGQAVLLAGGLVRLDTASAVDRQTERLVRAVLTGLTKEPADAGRPHARSAHTDRRG